MRYMYSEIDCVDSTTQKSILKNQLVSIDNEYLISKSGEIVWPRYNIGRGTIIIDNSNEIYYLSRKNSNRKVFLIEGVLVQIDDEIVVCIGEQNIRIPYISSIEYESSEMFLGYKLLYFVGQTPFVIILRNKEIIYANYYHEEKRDNQRVFVLRLHDMLNHGLAFGVSENKFTKYLIYLDDYDLKLKEEFAPFVFLDCVLAGNLKYATALINSDIQFGESSIKEFLPSFDRYISLTNTKHILIKKNTPKGICKFELNGNKIHNIILL